MGSRRGGGKGGGKGGGGVDSMIHNSVCSVCQALNVSSSSLHWNHLLIMCTLVIVWETGGTSAAYAALQRDHWTAAALPEQRGALEGNIGALPVGKPTAPSMSFTFLRTNQCDYYCLENLQWSLLGRRLVSSKTDSWKSALCHKGEDLQHIGHWTDFACCRLVTKFFYTIPQSSTVNFK